LDEIEEDFIHDSLEHANSGANAFGEKVGPVDAVWGIDSKHFAGLLR
jgi:hypothetical protein